VLQLGLRTAGPLRILALGAHSDDIEIGCGGAILSFLEGHPGSAVHWVVFSAVGEREQEARRSAAGFLEAAQQRDVRICDFRDGFLPYDGPRVKEYFERLKQEVSPDVVFTHRLEDRHQDHRLLSELTWNTFRNHVVVEYEIPKYEGDLGHPNLFVPLTPEIVKRKLTLLMTMFGSQRSKRWFTEDLFAGLMRLRAIEAGLPDGYAEAFHVRKVVLDPVVEKQVSGSL
jgi:LmbE family N-acetylglucosaminyl deacetylase